MFESVVGAPAGRGVTTITLAHITLSLAFVTAIVRARLATLDPVYEEAARDLGARPGRVSWTVTLPLLAPAIGAARLLAFTLSLDDLCDRQLHVGTSKHDAAHVDLLEHAFGREPRNQCAGNPADRYGGDSRRARDAADRTFAGATALSERSASKKP